MRSRERLSRIYVVGRDVVVKKKSAPGLGGTAVVVVDDVVCVCLLCVSDACVSVDTTPFAPVPARIETTKGFNEYPK